VQRIGFLLSSDLDRLEREASRIGKLERLHEKGRDRTREGLRSGTDPEKLGKPTLLPYRMTLTPADLVARDFGASFAAALEKVPVGEWVGPVDSRFGAHYVRVSDRTPAVAPQLTAVRDQVVREWENDRRQRARNDAYTKMRGEYRVSIETELATKRR